MEEKINYRNGNIIVLCLCLVIPLVTVARLLDHDNWVTAARSVQWVNGDGSASVQHLDKPYEFEMCYPIDNAIRGESHIWTMCLSQDEENKRMARIDLETKVGTFWYFPKKLPPKLIKGLSVGPDEALAVVYWTDDIPGRLVAGVLDEQGWQVKPTVLPHIRKASFHAMAWVNGKVNIVYSTGRLNPSKNLLPRIAQIGPDGIQDSVFRKPDAFNANTGVPCSFFIKKGVWQGRFAITGKNGDQCLELSENGACHVQAEELCGSSMSDNIVDLAALGEQHLPAYIMHPEHFGKTVSLAQLDGGRTNRPKAPLPGWRREYSNAWMTRSASGMRRIPFWIPDSGFSYIRPYGEGWLQTFTISDSQGRNIAIKLLDADGNITHNKAVTLDQLRSSDRLSMGVPLARREGGFWMVSASGNYLTLGPNLERLDGRSVWEHLRRRGSRHIVKLLWVLFGLPLSVLAGWVYARLFKKDRNVAYRASAMVFLVSGAICLIQLLPLLC